ncbi:MAG: hypothetical protein KGZ66_06510 [Selenomonadales bacterium]|nr:hypothetical protein [Selenomonadales bacterium]
MESQNVTLSLPKDILQKAKHIAVNRQVSLSRLLAESLAEIVRKDEAYSTAKSRQLAVMSSGLDLGLGFGIAKNVPWKRDDLHAR